jgi:hypothetical protein
LLLRCENIAESFDDGAFNYALTFCYLRDHCIIDQQSTRRQTTGRAAERKERCWVETRRLMIRPNDFLPLDNLAVECLDEEAMRCGRPHPVISGNG